VLERDGFRCGICLLAINPGLPVNHPLALTIDHVVPLAAGGSDAIGNLQPAHRQCNVDKGELVDGWEIARLRRERARGVGEPLNGDVLLTPQRGTSSPVGDWGS
jgi:5-methylcytosine-specific restriction endonuclease McrA